MVLFCMVPRGTFSAGVTYGYKLAVAYSLLYKAACNKIATTAFKMHLVGLRIATGTRPTYVVDRL